MVLKGEYLRGTSMYESVFLGLEQRVVLRSTLRTHGRALKGWSEDIRSDMYVLPRLVLQHLLSVSPFLDRRERDGQ